MGRILNKLYYNMDSLEKIQASLEAAKKYRARVGIFENEDARGEKKRPKEGSPGIGDGNADVGAKHEFGFTTDGGIRIPARSFLRVPLATHRGEIAGMMKINVMRALVYGKLEMLFKHLGIACEKIVDQAFQTSGWGTWRPNAPMTVLLKGSDKPLIDTGQLRRSIASKVKKL